MDNRWTTVGQSPVRAAPLLVFALDNRWTTVGQFCLKIVIFNGSNRLNFFPIEQILSIPFDSKVRNKLRTLLSGMNVSLTSDGRQLSSDRDQQLSAPISVLTTEVDS